jgi:uncharacterized protein (TIGR03086 family)
MSENLHNFTKAGYSMDAVVGRVPDGAWDQPAPGEGWSARDVVGHAAGVLLAVAEMAGGAAMVLPATPSDLTDPVGTWASARGAILAALDAPGALDLAGEYWFGPMTIDELIGFVQWDPMTHAWDVAQATGVPLHLDEELAQLSFERISSIREGLASMGLVGHEVTVDAGASVVDRYLAMVGRQPAVHSTAG